MNISGSFAFGFLFLIETDFLWPVGLASNAFGFRSPDCFSLGWPMRDDGEFFRSTMTQVFILLGVACLNAGYIFSTMLI